MSDISLDVAPGKTVKVRLSDWEFNEIVKQRHSQSGTVVNGGIGEYMVFATK